MQEKIRRNSDAIIGGIMLLMAVFVIILIMQIKNTQSRIMPFFAVALIAGGSVVLVFRTLILHKSLNVSLLHKKREIIVWLMFVGFFVFIRILGYFVSSFLFTCVCFLYLRGGFSRGGFNKEKLFITLFFALLFVVATYLCFVIGFKSSMPRGLII